MQDQKKKDGGCYAGRVVYYATAPDYR